MYMRPLLSIVVPTKDRYIYLKDCIKCLCDLRTKHRNVEIIIQDNSSDNSEIIPIIKEYEGEIKYFYHQNPLSIIENCDLAIKHTTGEYVCVLGDDDGVADSIVLVASWMKEKNIESCLGRIVRYNWANFEHNHVKHKKFVIPIPLKINSYINLEAELKKVLAVGGTNMQRLPRVYHAIVSKSALERIYDKAGSYFPGASPDMANAVALCFVLNNHVSIDMPFIISGFSYHSGGLNIKKKQFKKIEDIKHLPKDTAKLWDPMVPKYWTGSTIWAESVIKSLRRMGRNDLMKFFNVNALYASFLHFDWPQRRLLYPLMHISNWILLPFYIIKLSFIRCRFLLKNKFQEFGVQKSYSKNDVLSLYEAIKEVNEYNQTNKYELDTVFTSTPK